MSLVEITRFTDVYEADLAAAFLASHDIDVQVTERFQATVDPLMQRALGIRLMGREDQRDQAIQLLNLAAAGQFVEGDEDIEPAAPRSGFYARLVSLAGFMGGNFGGTSLPRRIRPIQVAGLMVIGTFVVVSWGLWLLVKARGY